MPGSTELQPGSEVNESQMRQVPRQKSNLPHSSKSGIFRREPKWKSQKTVGAVEAARPVSGARETTIRKKPSRVWLD